MESQGETDRQTETETERQRDRETERQREKELTHTIMETGKSKICKVG